MSHQFDDFIKGKFEQREFEFKDEYWDNAQELIRLDEKKQFRRKVYSATAAFALIGMIAIGAYFLGFNNGSTNLNIEGVQIAETKTIVEHKESNNTNTKALNDLNQIKEISTPNINSQINNNSSKNNQTIAATEQKNFETPIKREAIPSQITNKREITIYDKLSASSGIQEEKNSSINAIKSPINNIDAPLVGSNSNPSLNVSNQDEASQLPRVETMKFSNALIGNLALKSLQNKVEDFSAQDLLQIQEIPESALKYNSASNFSMGLKVGALLYLPTKKVGYQAGIIAAYKLKRNLSIGLEGTYNVKRNDFSNSEQSSTTRYSFGKEEVSYFLKPTEIHNVEIPLYLKYSFGYPKALDLNASKQERYLKHAVHAGFGVNLFNRVEAEVFEQKENQLLNSIEQGSLSQEYINSSNFNLLMGYEYFFKKSFSIGIRTKYQLNDLYKNTIPNQDGIEPSKLSIELNANIKLF